MLTLQISQFARTLYNYTTDRPTDAAIELACILGTQRPTSSRATTPEGDPCTLTITADTWGEASQLVAACEAFDAWIAGWAEATIKVYDIRKAA